VCGGTGSGRCLQQKSERSSQHRCAPVPQWHGHLVEVFVRIDGATFYLWRAVDREGEVLEAFVTKKRDRKAALKLLRKMMKRYGRPEATVTEWLSFIPGSHERDWQPSAPGDWPVAEQSGRKFTPAVQATRKGYGEIQECEVAPEFRFYSFFGPQSLQYRTSPVQPPKLQGQPHRFSCRVATNCGMIPNLRQAVLTGSLSPDAALWTTSCLLCSKDRRGLSTRIGAVHGRFNLQTH